ncbi:MAG: ArnT family glycosyltransferase [Lachnospiraceae bacterium]
MNGRKLFGKRLSFMAPYAVTVCLIFVLYVVATWMNVQNNEQAVERMMMITVIVIVLLAAALSARYRDKRGEILVAAVLMLGMVMRIGYMLYTRSFVRAHDYGTLEPDAAGHANYIISLYQDGRLPDSNAYQFYHPPLYYILSALVMHPAGWLTGADSIRELMNAAKIVSCAASCGTLLLIWRIAQECRLQKGTMLFVMSFAACFPNMFLLAGRVNNDSLSVFFQALIVLYTIRWYRDRRMKNIAVLAVAFGCGMMTKMSCAAFALFTGAVFLYVLIQEVKARRAAPIWKQFVLFGAVSVPLGLWYAVRNLIRFGQSFFYVYSVEENTALYVGDYSLFDRFIAVPWNQLFDPLYARPYDDYNVPMYIFKTSIFGEFSYDVAQVLPAMLLVVNVALIAVSLIAALYLLLFAKGQPFYRRFGSAFLWAVLFVPYLGFQISAPYGCTMDYRYIVLTAIIGVMQIGFAGEQLRGESPRLYRYVRLPVIGLNALFCVLSCLMYLCIRAV